MSPNHTYLKWASISCTVFLGLLMLKPGLLSLRHNPLSIRKHDELQLAKQFGFLGFYGTEIYIMLKPRPPIPPFPGKINPRERTAAPTFSFTPNIIFVQIESLDAQALYITIDGQPLLPHLMQLKEESIFFSNFFAQHRGGASQDAELSSLVSILPVNGRSGFNSLSIEQTVPLASILKDSGYFTAAFHANSGSFFNRNRIFNQIGFDAFHDKKDYTDTAKGWGSKDIAFFDQTIDKIEQLSEPFFAYLITMQSHGPFNNFGSPSEHLKLDNYSSYQSNYLRSIHEVDIGIGHLIGRLKSSGLWNKSIIFFYADHYSSVEYSAPDYPYTKQKLKEHIPLFIHYPNVTPRIIDKAGSHLDISPTLAHLLSFDEPEKWLGTSLLTPEKGIVILNYPRPIIYENDPKGIVQKDESSFTDPFIEWSEALQSR